ncbi:MAG: hypothetical protein Q8P20_07920 [bacterium]|nr:hypothetical protein [bacterium]
MVTKKIGRYQVFGSNGHFIVSRFDGYEYRVMHSVPSYTTLNGAVRKATALHRQDVKNGIKVKVPK